MKKSLFILFPILVMLNLFQDLAAQNNKTDSLWKVYNNKSLADTSRLKAIHIIAWSYVQNNPDTAIVLAKHELVLAAATLTETEHDTSNPNVWAGIKIIEAKAYNTIGVAFMNKGNYPEALKNHFSSLQIKEKLQDKKGTAQSYNNIGIIYDKQDNYKEALKNYFASLKIKKEIGDKKGCAVSYMNIGTIYNKQDNYTEALKNYVASLNIRQEIKDEQGMGFSYVNIGLIYAKQGDYSEALKNFFASLSINKKMDDKILIASCFMNLSNTYRKLAFRNLKKNEAHVLAEDKTTALKKGQLYLDSALQLSKGIGYKEVVRDCYKSLASFDSSKGDYKAAFAHHKLHILYRDSIDNEETQKKSLQASMQYEFDKKEIAAKAEQEKLDAVTKEEKQKQNIIIYSVAGVLLLVIAFSIFLFNRFRITNRQKIIIENQKILVDEAYAHLHEKNKEVMDSINYASRIQRALLPTQKYISNNLIRLIKRN